MLFVETIEKDNHCGIDRDATAEETPVKSPWVYACLLICLSAFSIGCSKSNNLLLGRVEEKLGAHLVIVTDCYKTSVPPPQLLKSANDKPFYRFTPCLDADVVIDDNQLIVNGISYGSIGTADTILVDHGKVLVNNKLAPPVNSPH